METYLNSIDQDTSLTSSLGQGFDGLIQDTSGGIKSRFPFNLTEAEYNTNYGEEEMLNLLFDEGDSTGIYDTTLDDEYSTSFTTEYITEDYGAMNESTTPTILSNEGEELGRFPNRPLDILTLTRFADSEGLVSSTGHVSVGDLCNGKSCI